MNLNYEITSFEKNADVCTRKIKISFDAFTSRGAAPIHYKGEGIIKLEYQFEWWRITSVLLPGM